MDLRVTHNAYFSFFTLSNHILLVTFCDMTAGNRDSFRTHRQTDKRTDKRTDGQTNERTDGQTDVEVEIVI